MRQFAKITSLEGNKIECVVQCGDVCGSCAARKVCAPSSGDGQSLKTITLYSTEHSYQVGDTIELEISATMGLRAVLLAYLIPVALIIGLLLTLQHFSFSELASGGITLGVVVAYFLSIKIFGLSRTISVQIVQDDSL